MSASARWRSTCSALRLLRPGAGRLLRGGRAGARQRAQHDARVHADERFLCAVRRQRRPLSREFWIGSWSSRWSATPRSTASKAPGFDGALQRPWTSIPLPVGCLNSPEGMNKPLVSEHRVGRDRRRRFHGLRDRGVGRGRRPAGGARDVDAAALRARRSGSTLSLSRAVKGGKLDRRVGATARASGSS